MLLRCGAERKGIGEVQCQEFGVCVRRLGYGLSTHKMQMACSDKGRQDTPVEFYLCIILFIIDARCSTKLLSAYVQ